MANLAVELSEMDEAFVQKQVADGSFRDAAEVVSAALERMRGEGEFVRMTEEELDDALEAGLRSGIAEGDVFADLRQRYGLPQRQPR